MFARQSLLDRLRSAVSPLDQGASALGVHGWRPAGREAHRPRRTAAVLVGILPEAETESGAPQEAEVILTLRSRRLARHAGQVAFPGGRADDDDPSGVRTALREAEEEIGLAPAHVQPLGFLDRVDTISDYRVLPVVGLVDRRARLIADELEVEAVFTVPLATVLDPAAYLATRIHRRGVTRVVYHLDWNLGPVANRDHSHVWGVTASILRNLALRSQGMDQEHLP
ncbi:MAG: CoA pyrophosphatase [Xanthomonadales bacterium]|jgi:8-oxo-dGTP pyrophosphatase MutT (NUDIX family)|nr:CoA pyrophosphatase [Xanthomonadales bacterium]